MAARQVIRRGMNLLKGKEKTKMQLFLKDLKGTVEDVGVSAATGTSNPMTLTAQGVYGVLKAAGKHARRLEPDNLFRRMTVNRYGIPPSMQRRMYKNNTAKTSRMTRNELRRRNRLRGLRELDKNHRRR